MEPTNRIELPAHAFEAWIDLRNRILECNVDHETAQHETIEILRPYWTHQPQPWESTEVVLKTIPMSQLYLPK